MVEAAIVMPLLMLLVFGIIEWGLAFLTATSTNSAARAGARTASALTKNSSYADQAVLAVEQNLKGAIPFATPLEMWVYRVDPAGTNTSGYPAGNPGFTDCTVDCIKYTWNGTDFVQTGGPGWSAASQQACGSPTSFDSLGVYLKVRHNFVTNFFGSSKIISEHTVMRLEPQPLNNCP